MSALSNLNGSDRVGRGDTTQHGGGAIPMATADYSTPQAQAALLASDQGLANLYGIPLNQVTPQLISQYQQQQAAKSGGFWDQVIMNKVMPALAVGLATAGIGSAAGGALGGTLGTTGASIAGGAVQGAAAGALGSTLQGGNIGKGALFGGITGGVGGGLSSLASPVTNSLAGSIGQPLASGVVRGTIGAGTGALASALTGGNPGNGAFVGGVSGAAQGATTAATGSPLLGGIAGTIGGYAGRSLTQPSPQSPSGQPSPASLASGMPSMPLTASPAGVPPAAPTNIGSYSGYGYAPRQQIQSPVSDYSTYGQGPEANFFTPMTQAAQPAQAMSNAPVMNNPMPMMSATQGSTTRTNST